MPGLPREVLKWLQSLDLTWQIKHPKWDLTNGFLIAEIFSWYYPNEIHMNYFNTGESYGNKEANWITLRKFVRTQKMDIPLDVMDANLHCKENAAKLLIERMYEILTKRTIRRFGAPSLVDCDYTDKDYQMMLPLHARSTAAKSIKNNLKSSEMYNITDIFQTEQMAQTIIEAHIERRKAERLTHPLRFEVRPTLGEQSVRRPPLAARAETDSTEFTGEGQESRGGSDHSTGTKEGSISVVRSALPPFKEVHVRQMDRIAQFR